MIEHDLKSFVIGQEVNDIEQLYDAMQWHVHYVARIRAIRELIEPDIAFMVDANYAMTVPEAIAAAEAFKPYDLLWFEEPTIPDDYKGFGTIAAQTGMPLAMGENLHIRQGSHNIRP